MVEINTNRKLLALSLQLGLASLAEKLGMLLLMLATPWDPMPRSRSYAQEQILPASVAIPVPPSVDHKQAASVMLKGMTAHVLLRRVFKVLRHIDTAK
jgi:NADPH:quinone reductase-like Zn-dependent oxidoreductase